MKYSGWTAFLYSSSAFRDMSEALAGLERAMKMAGAKSPSGTIRPYKNFEGCIPPFNCTVRLRRLEGALRELERTAGSSFALALRVIAEAKANGIREFSVRLSGPVGPAPDREDPAARRPAPRRPMPRRPRPKRPKAKRRAR